ncbi:phosphotransferase [Microlunatus sp. Gsoil 973]|uniref:phosphotransferase n=1 Tax=Microlunatus sp. Gsoil 973 TaxID=2672569 RepID=UPI0012B4BA53|nr:phosphotransferase [Microlunatus sp. Gsoil 973]QGN32533.1 phosphotransferase [Microlunatus sp. Gsoil 973]
MGVVDQIHAAAARLVAPGSHVDRVRPFRTLPRPFPAELLLATPAGPMTCVVKSLPEADSPLGVEAAVLDALGRVGCRAPTVLAGPKTVPTDSGRFDVLVMTRLSGEPLPWIRVSDVAVGDRSCRLLFDAVDGLHALTEQLVRDEVADRIPRQTLDQELAEVLARTTPWAGTRLFQDAVQVLEQQLPRRQLPLVFSNGDYNPLNVLADDRGRSVGSTSSTPASKIP